MIDQEGIKIETRFLDEENQIALVELSGYVDQNNVHVLQSTIDHSLENKVYRLIFDMKDLVYMSSAGWGVLIGEIKRFRENGGDIKLVNMNPEIYEVYQMLEFYHILSEYPSVEDALQSFYGGKGRKKPPAYAAKESLEMETDIETEQVVEKSATQINDILDQFGNNNNNNNNQSSESETVEEEIELEIDEVTDKDLNVQSRDSRTSTHVEFNPVVVERAPDLSRLPIQEKIRAIVAQFPHFGPWKIRKMLRHREFGEVKISYFKLRRLLKQLELDTKEKRYRYYRSC